MACRQDEAFVSFVRGAQGRLHHLAWLLTGDVHRAAELVQEALVRTYGAWSRIQNDDPAAYARRVLVNARTDSWRRRRREHLVEEPPEPPPSPRDPVAGVDQRLALVSALRRLSARERAVIVLRYFVDLSEADTAAELGVSVGTVKSTASRALARLRDESRVAATAGSARQDGPPTEEARA